MSADGDLHDEAPLGQTYDGRLFGRLLGYVRPYRGRMAIAVGLIVFSSLLQLVGPLATAVALDLFVRPLGSESQQSAVSQTVERWLETSDLHPSPVEGLVGLSAIYLGALFLAFFVLYAQGYVMQIMGQYIMRDLRGEIFGKVQALPVAYFDRRPIGRILTRVTTDVDALNELFTAGFVAIFGDIVLLAGIAGVLFWLDWRLALVTFAILPFLFLLTGWFKARARAMYRKVRTRIARINAYLQEHITGMSIVQLFGREESAFREFDEINRDHRNVNVEAIFYYAIYYPAVELLTSVGTALVIWYGGGQVVRGAVSIGALVAFLQYAQRFYQPIADLSEKYNILQAAMASSERIFRLLDRDVVIESPAEAHAPVELNGAIEFDRVHFSYVAGEPVLRDVSFTIEPGQTVAVVGHTGAGKSTLANLMLRFYDVDQGAIAVDGVDVRQWELVALRRSTGLVLQDVFLFSDTVAANVRLGATEISPDRIAWALREVQAEDLVDRLDHGLDTRLRERGAGLSVGQKQLLAFARALAFDPSVLILDEATSSIDTETEQRIQVALDRLLADRTSIVIAHRLSTIQRADRILVMHKGELREQGTHQELVAAGGIYRRLYELQYQERAAV